MLVNLATVCPICGKETILTVLYSDYIRYTEGELIQRAFPYLSATQREMLITGYCGDCWDMMFSQEDEEE